MNENRGFLNSVGLLVLRLGLGGTMVYGAGWNKLKLLLDGNYNIVGDPIGLGAGLSSFLIVAAEFLAAGLVAIGLVTRLAALGPVCAMSVAFFVAHAEDPFARKMAPLVFLVGFAAIVFTGPGRFSVDALLFGRHRSETEN